MNEDFSRAPYVKSSDDRKLKSFCCTKDLQFMLPLISSILWQQSY